MQGGKHELLIFALPLKIETRGTDQINFWHSRNYWRQTR